MLRALWLDGASYLEKDMQRDEAREIIVKAVFQM